MTPSLNFTFNPDKRAAISGKTVLLDNNLSPEMITENGKIVFTYGDHKETLISTGHNS